MNDIQTPTPAEVEAISDVIEFEHDGTTYTVPRDRASWPLRVALFFEKGLEVRAVELLLGDQFAAFLRTEPTQGDFQKLYKALTAALTGGRGE